ncbi:hypothetical protein FB446DRAFT_706063 [Lentinula raphanica]|nr:hypothetical protein FB446DRAFT_706063 [Lentinula raphanica]
MLIWTVYAVGELVNGRYIILDRAAVWGSTLPSTNLGPIVSLASAVRIRKQVEDAVKAGAKNLIPEELSPEAKVGLTYVAPQVLVDVDHSMDVMMVRLSFHLLPFPSVAY